MPTSGFKTITFPTVICERFDRAYAKSRKVLKRRGIRSTSGYVSNTMLDILRNQEAMKDYPPRFEILGSGHGRIVLLDRENDRAVEVITKDEEPFCPSCDSRECAHVGYVYGRGLHNPKAVKASMN